MNKEDRNEYKRKKNQEYRDRNRLGELRCIWHNERADRDGISCGRFYAEKGSAYYTHCVTCGYKDTFSLAEQH
jgi:hypothetical protein